MLRRKVGLLTSLARCQAERGQGLVEYALIILFVAIALVAALGALGSGIGSSILDSASSIPGGS